MKAEDLYLAMTEVAPVYLEESESWTRKRSGKVVLRSVLIAAAIAAAGCMTALAVTFSLRDSARMDMGISKEAPIPEWTEYEGVGTADTGPEAAEEAPAQAVLTATLCSGERLCAYVEVSPVDPEVAVILADTSWEYEWDMAWRGLYNCTGDAEQIDYNPETQTALVRVSLTGDGLEQVEQVEVTLYLDHELKAEASYGPVVIPITQAERISCPADVTVRNVKAHLTETINPALLSEVEIPDYVSEGRITQISICAGYLEVELETPGLDQWLPLTGLEQVEIEQPDLPHEFDLKNMFLRGRFLSSWCVSVNEALTGATLNYRDGTSQSIDEIPTAYAGKWGRASGSVYEGKNTYQFIPQQAFDLSQIKSVTMGGVEYVFPTED